MKKRNYVVLVLLAVALLSTAYAVRIRPKVFTVKPAQHSQANYQGVEIKHIVLIIEENKTASSIIGSSQAPYINNLAHSYSLAENYNAATNPSLPNYIALTSGTTAGIANDCNPPGRGCEANVNNIADSIEASGRSWKEYAESMPSPCYSFNSGNYAVKHNPFLYYPDIRNNSQRCRDHVVPFSQFNSDLKSNLPDFSFITPDLCSDMHDCSVSNGDSWLKTVVPKILGSNDFTKQKSLLIITWDEGNTADNNVPAIFAGPAAKKGYVSSQTYSHYSLLKTIEYAWGLSPLTYNDKNSPAMTDMLD